MDLFENGFCGELSSQQLLVANKGKLEIETIWYDVIYII